MTLVVRGTRPPGRQDDRHPERPAGGACLCGAIEFEVQGPYAWMAHCYCSMCRKHHGSLFSTSLGVHLARFRFLGGEHLIRRYRSSAAFERAFCNACGSKTPAVSQSPAVMNVPAGTILDVIDTRPRTHIFVGSKAPCWTIADTLPQFEAYPPSIELPSIERAQPAARPDGAAAGSCLCGAVAFQIDAAADGGIDAPINCHCSRCRRSRGAAHSTDFEVRSDRFRWTRGAELVRHYELPELPRLPSASSFATAFCGACGSLMPSLLSESGGVCVPVGSLDTPLEVGPVANVCTGSKASWYEISDSLPRFVGQKPKR